MRIISKSESHSWIAGTFHEPFSWHAVESRYVCNATYLVPTDAGRKTALARTLVTLLDSRSEGLLWITGWGVFPSSENMTLFQGYRQTLQDERSLSAAPGHVFGGSDLNELECVLALVLYFSWDASVFDAGATWLRLSHDEVLSVSTTDRETLGRWRENLLEFELEELSAS